MALLQRLEQRHTFAMDLDEFTEHEKRLEVPNHLLDTKIYNRLTKNEVAKVTPGIVYFAGFEIGKWKQKTIKICNVSYDRQNIHIIPPGSRYFKIHYAKPNRFVAGAVINVTIKFLADECRYFYDCIRIHCKGEENLVVPIHGFPVLDTSNFPQKLTFHSSKISLGQEVVKKIDLTSRYPVMFQYEITILQSHPAFQVSPLSGMIQGHGSTTICVKFTPTEYITAHMTMQLTTSQFNSEPLLCDVTACCSPHLEIPLTKSVKALDAIYNSAKLLDPRSLSPIQIARDRQQRGRVSIAAGQEFPGNKIERGGYLFPANISSQYAVNSVLNQTKGKLRVKDLRALTESASVGEGMTRQMKEAAFEKIVQQDIVDERANQLRWQVHLGNDPVSDEDRNTILDERQAALDIYSRYHKKIASPQEEMLRASTFKSPDKTQRMANLEIENEPKFDLYVNNPWPSRHRALFRFQQAARTIIVRCRADMKIVMTRKMIEDYAAWETAAGPIVSDESLPAAEQMSPFDVEVHIPTESDKVVENFPENFNLLKVLPFAFSFRALAVAKDDTAAETLSVVQTQTLDVVTDRMFPFYDLVVPKYYETSGYERMDVEQSLRDYISPKLARKLKTGARDELINVPVLKKDDKLEEAVENFEMDKLLTKQDAIDQTESSAGITSSGLIPPSGMFKNPTHHDMYIFNRAPGLVEHYLPLPHSQVDPDYHLCPEPKYNMLPGSKTFLDRDDVIKGIMSWKKFPSHGLKGLSSVPTLSDVWMPRWADPFSQSILPEKTLPLLNSLPEDDAALICDDDSQAKSILLTPDMVKAQFAMEDQILKEAKEAEDDDELAEVFPRSSKLPTDNIGLSSTGLLSKQQRLEELEIFIQWHKEKAQQVQDSHLNFQELEDTFSDA